MSAHRQLGLLWGAVALGLLGAAPFGHRLAAVVPACPIRTWLDLPCLTCGTTRAALALSRLDLAAALAYNPLAAVGWMVLVGGGIVAGVAAAAGRPLPELRLQPTVTFRASVAAALLVNWIYLVLSG